jgi:hypothetical protein
MRAPVLCLLLVGCGVTGFRVAKKVDGPPRPASPSAEIVDAPPSGAEELGRVEVIGFDGEACKAEAKERARTLLGASHVVVASHPAPFDWQNTQTETVAAPRCVGTGYLAAPGALVPAPTPAAAPPPDMAPAPTPPPATPPPAT